MRNCVSDALSTCSWEVVVVQSNMPLKKRHLSITQANALALSAQEMTLMEKRLVLVGIAKLDVNDPTLKVKLFVNEFNDIFGVSSNANHERLRDITKQLLSRVVHVEQESGEWEMFQWVNYAHYKPGRKSDEGTFIEMEFNKQLTPYLQQLTRNFNSYTLEKIAGMQSFYSVRVFEILHHDSHGGRAVELEYELDDLKFRLRLKYEEKGRKIDRYPNFKDFRVRVLEQAQRDCEAYTHMTFNFEGKRKGRKIASVVFTLKPKTQLPLLSPPNPAGVDPLEIMQLADDLRGAGFTGDASAAIHTYGTEYVRATLKLALKAERDGARTAKPIRNLGGLIQHLLKSGAAQTTTLSEDEDAPKSLSDKQMSKLTEQLVQTFAFARNEHSQEVWNTLDDDEQDAIHAVMRVDLNSVTLKELDKQGWQGSSYEALRNGVLFDNHHDLYDTYLHSLEAFVAEQSLFSEYDVKDKQRILQRAAES